MAEYARRTVLGASIAAVGSGVWPAGFGDPLGVATGWGSRADSRGPTAASFAPRGPAGYVNPSDPEVIAAERKRGAGQVRRVRLVAGATSLDLGGPAVRSWAYGDTLPGKAVRVTAGEVLDSTLANRLPEATTLHSHGIRLRCDMDGVPGLTQRPIQPGRTSGTASLSPTRARTGFIPTRACSWTGACMPR